MGGLGNQLFEIATAYAHARRNGYQLQISPTTNCRRDVYWDSFIQIAYNLDAMVIFSYYLDTMNRTSIMY